MNTESTDVNKFEQVGEVQGPLATGSEQHGPLLDRHETSD